MGITDYNNKKLLLHLYEEIIIFLLFNYYMNKIRTMPTGVFVT